MSAEKVYPSGACPLRLARPCAAGDREHAAAVGATDVGGGACDRNGLVCQRAPAGDVDADGGGGEQQSRKCAAAASRPPQSRSSHARTRHNLRTLRAQRLTRGYAHAVAALLLLLIEELVTGRAAL